MIRVICNTGEAFEASSAEDLVRLMIRSDRLHRRKRLATFMRGVAERCAVDSAAHIDTKNANDFLNSLARAGYITIEWDTAT